MKSLLVILICLPLAGFSQAPIFNKVELSHRYEINDLEQDEYGFLWLATDKGLVILNGFEEILVKPSSTDWKPCALDIRNGTVCVGTEHGHIDMALTGTRKFFLSRELSSRKITDIKFFGENQILVSSGGEGFFHYDLEKDSTLHHLNTEELANIYEFVNLDHDMTFLATEKGLFSLTKQFDPFELLISDVITNVTAGNNFVWASNYNSKIFKINSESEIVESFDLPQHEKINKILCHQEELFITTDNHVYSLTNTGKFIDLNIFSGNRLSFNQAYVDSESNLWISYLSNNLSKANLLFRIYPFQADYEVRTVLEHNKNLLLGTSEGLKLYDLESHEIKHIASGNVTVIKSVKDLIYCGTYSKGILIFDRYFNLVHKIDSSNGLLDNTILDLEIDDERMVTSTLSGIFEISLASNSTGKSVIAYDEKFALNYVLDIMSSNDGKIWFGKDRSGISVLDQGKLISYETWQGKKIGSVYSIAQASDNSIWFTSSKLGVLRFDQDSLMRFPINYSEDDPYTSLIPLQTNNILLVKKSSIDLLDIDRGHIMYYDREADVVQEEPFLNNFTVSEERLWFLHHNRIYSFIPPEKYQKIHPTTYIDRVEVNLEDLVESKVEFDHNQNNFKFHFTGGWLTDPSKLTYKYKLDGYDKHWRTTSDRFTDYPHLPPGDYTFNIKSAENKIFTDEPITSYNFSIKPALYMLWWFKVLVTILFASFIYFLIRRYQKIKAMQAALELNQIEGQLLNLKAQLNPHFLFNSFNTLCGLVEESKGKAVDYIQNLSGFYRSILEVNEKELIPLKDEIDLTRQYENLLKERFPTGFSISYGVENFDFMIPPLTIQMLVENAIKHNQVDGDEELLVRIEQSSRLLRVQNNKIEKNYKSKSIGLGLKNISQRFQLLGLGKIQTTDSVNEFEVILPLKSM